MCDLNFMLWRSHSLYVDPVGASGRNDVLCISMWRHYVALTTLRRHFDVMCQLGIPGEVKLVIGRLFMLRKH